MILSNRLLTITTIMILIFVSLSANINALYSTQFIVQNKNNIKDPFDYGGFTLEDLSYSDACYKGASFLRPFEWWYFDANFDNGYSIEFHINLASQGRFGIIAPMLNIYRDGLLVFHDAQFYPYRHLSTAQLSPNIEINNHQYISGYLTEDNLWVIDISCEMSEGKIDLQFFSTCPGYKARIIDLWWWGAIIPQSRVTGQITVQNETISVSGNGYYEHSWDAKLPLVWGWFWGRFGSENISVIWTEIFKNPLERYLMIVFNTPEGYFNVPYQNITITLDDYILNDGWIIPSTFYFTVNHPDIKMDVKAETNTIVHQTSILVFNYWRYHVQVIGTLSYQNTTYNFNSEHIMDLTRFW